MNIFVVTLHITPGLTISDYLRPDEEIDENATLSEFYLRLCLYLAKREKLFFCLILGLILVSNSTPG